MNVNEMTAVGFQKVGMTAQRLQMRAHGYSPLPLNGKAPQIAAWQKRSDATDREIRSWARGRPAETNTGLLTRNNPAFDIDILSNADAAQAVADLIAEELRGRGKLIVRFGRKPKRAIVCRATEPFKKIRVDLESVDPDTGEIQHNAIEILGDGQQLACFGEHPDTKQPYEWVGGSPVDVPASDLPLISEADARIIIDKTVAMLGEQFGIRPRCSEYMAARPDAPVAEAKTTDVATAWGAAALRRACEMIANAGSGSQEATLNGQCYGIGQLVAGGELPEGEALSALRAAAAAMTDYDPRNPWHAAAITQKVKRAIAEGKSKPRAAPEAEHVEFALTDEADEMPPQTDEQRLAAVTAVSRVYVRARLANGGEHPRYTEEVAADLGPQYREAFFGGLGMFTVDGPEFSGAGRAGASQVRAPASARWRHVGQRSRLDAPRRCSRLDVGMDHGYCAPPE